MSAPVLPPKAAERLAKIVGLLGSDQPGEVCNAASAADRLLRDHGMTWEALILRPLVTSPAAYPPPPPPQSGWRGAVAACQARPELLTRWERTFLDGLAQRRTLTAKQAIILSRLVDRVTI